MSFFPHRPAAMAADTKILVTPMEQKGHIRINSIKKRYKNKEHWSKQSL